MVAGGSFRRQHWALQSCSTVSLQQSDHYNARRRSRAAARAPHLLASGPFGPLSATHCAPQVAQMMFETLQI